MWIVERIAKRTAASWLLSRPQRGRPDKVKGPEARGVRLAGFNRVHAARASGSLRITCTSCGPGTPAGGPLATRDTPESCAVACEDTAKRRRGNVRRSGPGVTGPRKIRALPVCAGRCAGRARSVRFNAQFNQCDRSGRRGSGGGDAGPLQRPLNERALSRRRRKPAATRMRNAKAAGR